MIVLLYKLQTLKAVDAKINGALKRHVLDDADLKVRTKYISTRNAKREMNLFAILFYFLEFFFKTPYSSIFMVKIQERL
jgi:hypothetical protein